MNHRPLPVFLLLAACEFVSIEGSPPDSDTDPEAVPAHDGPRVQVLDADASNSSSSTDWTTDDASSSSSSTGDVSPSSTSDGSSSSSDDGSSSSTGVDPCACCLLTPGVPGCEIADVEACTCAWDDGVTSAEYCCAATGSWTAFCVGVAQDHCGLDCSGCGAA